MTCKAVKLHINGIVQGVGFRPFVYNLARSWGIKGWVANTPDGIDIQAEGLPPSLDAFSAALKNQAPPLAVIDSIAANDCKPGGYIDFSIRPSGDSQEKTALVSPDVATCPACRDELSNPTNRRYHYPFINCTNCGPRFSIIQDIPYDRRATTMQQFTMCPDCQAEYDNPANRRFHAQPNACPVCGPGYRLLDSNGRQLSYSNHSVFTEAKSLLAKGAILAIKGLGGFHLAVNAKDEAAVSRLRMRKTREAKPFAIMAGSMDAVKAQCTIDTTEEKLLTSQARPIVLVKKGADYRLADSLSPGNPYIGVMLPYTPAHYLLLGDDDILVMTSGNVSDEPIAYQDEDAFERLHAIADYFLIHNRDIHCRTEDSVVRVFLNEPYFIRRSRGYVPAPVRLAQAFPPVLAVGGELKNTFCLTRGRQAFISCHIGDLKNLSTYHSYIEAINHLKKLLTLSPELVACDQHPEYLSTKYAESLGLPIIPVQHHHAHIAAVMAEHHITGPVIGLAFDGTGYGEDGTLWGGEFLVADLKEFRRAGHLGYLRLPGGETAIREPWRLALWLLKETYGQDFINLDLPFVRKLPTGWELVLTAAENGINAPLADGAGRIFDAVAALLGIRQAITYEGQAAIELEQAAQGCSGRVFSYDTKQKDSQWVLDYKPLFAALCQALQQGTSSSQLAADFHTTLAVAACDVARKISQETGIKKVVLSGGVFQNVTFLTQVVGMLTKHELMLYLHRQTPANDGGLALGQAVVAGERSR